MADKFDIYDYGYERTVWANIQLSKLCPGNDVTKLDELLNCTDTVKQYDTMITLIEIMNQAYNRKMAFLDPDYEQKLITKEMLLNTDDDTLGNACKLALGIFNEDGKETVEAEPTKKEEAEEIRSE